MKICLSTFDPKKLDLKYNFNIIKNIVSKEIADIFVFPELSLTGYISDFNSIKISQIDLQKYLELIQKLSNEINCLIIIGYPVKEMANYYIAQGVFSPFKKREEYYKTHLGRKEKEFFTPGNELKLFNYKDLIFGISLCYELHIPNIAQYMAVKGAKMLFAPHAVPCSVKNREQLWNKYLPARAYDNGIYLGACNLKKGLMCFDPEGNLLSKNFEEGSNSLIVDINPNWEPESTKKRYIDFLRPELYIT